MLIQLSDKYRLTSDAWNIIVQERRIKQKTGEEYWQNASYHPSVEKAVKWVFKYETRLSDARSVQELLDTIKSTDNALQQTLEALKIVRM